MTIGTEFSGLTLLFVEDRPDGEFAVLKSFAVPGSSVVQAVQAGYVLGLKVKRFAKVPTEYLGLSDVFAVGGAATTGQLVGRVTYDEWLTTEDVESARRAFSPDLAGKSFRVELGMLAGRPVRHGIAASTLVDASSAKEAETIARNIGDSPGFITKVAAAGSESEEELLFVEVVGVTPVDVDPQMGGPFESVERLVGTSWEIADELIDEKDLADYFGDETWDAQADIDDPRQIVGAALSSCRMIQYLKKLGLEAEPDESGYIVSDEGIEFSFAGGDQLGAIFLFGNERETPYNGHLPLELSFEMSRSDVRSHLGSPADFSNKPRQGPIYPFDIFACGATEVHVLYDDLSQIQRIIIQPNLRVAEARSC